MGDITNKRVLIVEDNGLIGEVVAETLAEGGAWPIGPALTENEALDMIAYNPGLPDAAILDATIGGRSFRVAERLHALGVPFLFATGIADTIPETFQAKPVCSKPYTARELLDALAAIFEPEPVPAV